MYDLKQTLKKYKNVYIYGAGKTARKLLQTCVVFGIEVTGIVVSKYDGIIIPGISVHEIEDVKVNNDEVLFLIATDPSHYDSILDTLSRSGFSHTMVCDDDFLSSIWLLSDYTFIDRRKGYEKCCIVLAGYKSFLWENVFGRLIKYIPTDVEVCLCSSGILNEELEVLAQTNGWSYLSTPKNSVTLIQNIAFSLYREAEWIYKIDEDMFITNGVFEKLMQGYERTMVSGTCQAGIVAPLIPLNGYGYIFVLRRLGLLEEYERVFGRALSGGNPDSEIEKNADTAVFVWDRCGYLDDINQFFSKEGVHLCPVRFSIGMILMRRELWIEMGGFSVSGSLDLGMDEEDICGYCINHSKGIYVCHNAVVGHFSFGKQTEKMKEYYHVNKTRFSIH